MGFQAFNLGSHFNPRDVVTSLASPRFGQRPRGGAAAQGVDLARALAIPVAGVPGVDGLLGRAGVGLARQGAREDRPEAPDDEAVLAA